MERLEKYIIRISRVLNGIAGAAIVLTMILVVMNVLLRKLFKSPILGAYEFTGYLISAAIALGIAYCAVLDGHIAIDFIMEKLSVKIQRIIYIFNGIGIFIFMMFFSYRIAVYASSIVESRLVSPASGMNYYYFVYLIAAGFLLLGMVIFFKTTALIKGDGKL